MCLTQGKNLDALLTLSKKREKAFDDYLFSNLIIYPETFFQLKAAKAKETRYRKLGRKKISVFFVTSKSRRRRLFAK